MGILYADGLIDLFLPIQLTVDLLSGQSSANAASLVAEERKLEPASAPIQSRQEEGNTVGENTQKPRNAKSDRVKVGAVNIWI